MIRTSSEPALEPSADALVRRSCEEIQPAALQQQQQRGGQGGGDVELVEAPGVGPGGAPRSLLLKVPSARDWGHITPSGTSTAGTRSVSRMAAAAQKAALPPPEPEPDPGGASTSAAPPQQQQQRKPSFHRTHTQLRAMADDDAVLLIGGDLSVTVVLAQGLAGNPKATHAFARVHIIEPFPTNEGARPPALPLRLLLPSAVFSSTMALGKTIV